MGTGPNRGVSVVPEPTNTDFPAADDNTEPSGIESIEQAFLPGLGQTGLTESCDSSPTPSSDHHQRSIQALQERQLRDEHPLRLAYLKAQAEITRLQRVSQGLRVVSQVLVSFVGGVFVIGILVLLNDAIRSRAIVIQEFNTPPALAGRGLSGRVVAASLLDELTLLQSSTRTRLEKRKVADAWTSEIELEVPSTGLSVKDFEHLLRKRFGNDLHVSGDLIQLPNGNLSLRVRGDHIPARSFPGDGTDIQNLSRQAAEYVLEQTQPSIYVAFLIEKGKSSQAVEFSQRAFPTASPTDRPDLLNQWANALQNIGRPAEEALFRYRKALELKPDSLNVHSNIMLTLMVMGKEQKAWEYGKKHLPLKGGLPPPRSMSGYGVWNRLTWNLQDWRNTLVEDASKHQGLGSGNQLRYPLIALIDSQLHDLESARFQLSLKSPGSHDSTVKARTHFVLGRLATLAGQPKEAVVEMERFKAEAAANRTVSATMPGYVCWVALAQEEAGFQKRADETLKQAGTFVDCLRFKGDILDHRGNWRKAQSAYADAVRMAPDLPAGYYSWGRALFRHGAKQQAIEKFAAAVQRAPGWADPLKAWGDVLASQGRWAEARKKYESALHLAPQWPELMKAVEAARNQRYAPMKSPLGN